METHLHLLGLPPPPPHFTKASPWMIKLNPTPTHHPTTPPTFSTKRSIQLQAQGRGFRATTTPAKKQRPEQDDNNRDDDDDVIPQVVFDRMIRRVLSYVGLPMASGLGLLYVLGLLKEHGLWDVPGWLPLLTALLAFGTSALGMAYGTLSTSWDPNKEGSLLGWDEVLKNWPEMMREQENDKR